MEFQIDVRLQDGRHTWEGRVEVRRRGSHDDGWATICAQDWTIRESMVVCRQLKINFAKQPLQVTLFRKINCMAFI